MNILSGCHVRIDSPSVFSTRKNRPIAGYSKASARYVDGHEERDLTLDDP
jgi:hypothetical protein